MAAGAWSALRCWTLKWMHILLYCKEGSMPAQGYLATQDNICRNTAAGKMYNSNVP